MNKLRKLLLKERLFLFRVRGFGLGPITKGLTSFNKSFVD